MPISTDQLRALSAAFLTEAEETLRARGWDGHVVLVRNPFADEVALRVDATARLANQQAISGHEIEMMRGEVVDYYGQILRRMLNQYPALPGSREMTERHVTDLRRLEEMGLRGTANVQGRNQGLQNQDLSLLNQGLQGVMAGAYYGLGQGQVLQNQFAQQQIAQQQVAEYEYTYKKPTPKIPAPPEPEPLTKWERLMGEDVI